MDGIIIRLEQPEDYRVVERLTRAAFYRPDDAEQAKAGRPTEHYIVHRLRKQDGIMELSLVAERDGEILGHVIYSKAQILRPDGATIDVATFGPLSVCPRWQRMGVGSELMRHSIERARALGHGAILFFGHPEYYPRFGFVEAKEYGIADRGGNNHPAFMAMELVEGYLGAAAGRFIQSDLVDVDAGSEEMKQFDKAFVEP